MELPFGLAREKDGFLKIGCCQKTATLPSWSKIDELPDHGHHSSMACTSDLLDFARPHVVGSFSSASEMKAVAKEEVSQLCDIAEVRLDLMGKDAQHRPWEQLNLPLLFTARRKEEGGALDASASERSAMLFDAIKDADIVDIEVASIPSMGGLLDSLKERSIPWVASFHDFHRLPDASTLAKAVQQAHEAGATIFKLAAHLDSPADMARLADFQRDDHGLRKATMGMGPLAAVSRLLCAQCGSALNYGYIGKAPTAPGQWDAGLLKEAIARLTPIA